jgi:uncharacterized membrane-anchored protein
MSGNSSAAGWALAAACWILFLMGAASAQQRLESESAAQGSQPDRPSVPAARQADAEQAVRLAAQRIALRGPQTVALIDQAQLVLPEGYGFVPRQEAAAVMELLGKPRDERLLGIVLPEAAPNWLASLGYAASGHIEDGDARAWDAAELLEALQARTQRGNATRREQGLAPIEVTEWIEAPSYDFAQHHLVWAAQVREIGGNHPDPILNYNTYVLGREDYVSLNLITSSSQIDSHKPVARQLLAAIQFNAGKRYTDFNEETDPVADFGLSGLIGGIDVQLGLLATLTLLLAKFAKFILMGIAALAAILVRAFRRRRHAA